MTSEKLARRMFRTFMRGLERAVGRGEVVQLLEWWLRTLRSEQAREEMASLLHDKTERWRPK